MRLKMSSGKWRPFCLSFNVLMGLHSSYPCQVQPGKLVFVRSPMWVKILAGRVENRPGQVEVCIGYIRDCPVRASAKKFWLPSLKSLQPLWWLGPCTCLWSPSLLNTEMAQIVQILPRGRQEPLFVKIHDSRFLLYQQYHTNGSTIMTKTDVHTNTNLVVIYALSLASPSYQQQWGWQQGK